MARQILFTSIAWVLLIVPCLSQLSDNAQLAGEFVAPANPNELYRIEGKIFPHDANPLSNLFIASTKVVVNYGQYFGYLK